MSVINLGGIDFQGFEIPDEIHLGGCHAGKLWKLPGGERIFDAQGPDDDPIKWSGRFRGNSALSRATALDALRRSGLQVQFSVLGLAYSVYIKHFSFRPKHALEIPYSIELEVIEDQGQGLTAGFTSSIDTLVALDVATGEAFAGSIDSGSSDALSQFSSTIAVATPMASASLSALIPVKTAGAALTNAVQSAAAIKDTEIVANPLMDDDLGIVSILSILDALNNESALLSSYGYFGRAVVNVKNATG